MPTEKKGGGAWTVFRFKGGLGKKEGVVLLSGGWYPNAHNVLGYKMSTFSASVCHFLFKVFHVVIFLDFDVPYQAINRGTKPFMVSN